MSEVKNVKSLSYTRQLSDFTDLAHRTVSRLTTRSNLLLEAIEAGLIKRRLSP